MTGIFVAPIGAGDMASTLNLHHYCHGDSELALRSYKHPLPIKCFLSSISSLVMVPPSREQRLR